MALSKPSPAPIIPAATARPDLWRGVVAAYPLWEGAGRAFDLGHGRYHGTLGGTGASWTTTNRGRAVYINRDTLGRITCPSALNASATFGTIWTQAYWLRARANAGTYRQIQSFTGGAQYLALPSDTDRRIRAFIRTAAAGNLWVFSSGSINLDEWWHVVFEYRPGAGYKYWLNGKVDSDITNADTGFASGTACAIGGTTTGASWHGDIASAVFWNRRLTDSEVKALYDDPWAMFRPQATILTMVGATGTAVSPPAYSQVSFRLYADDGTGLGEPA